MAGRRVRPPRARGRLRQRDRRGGRQCVRRYAEAAALEIPDMTSEASNPRTPGFAEQYGPYGPSDFQCVRCTQNAITSCIAAFSGRLGKMARASWAIAPYERARSIVAS